MNRPSNEQLQRKIAEVLGCIWVEDKGIPDWGPVLVLPDTEFVITHHQEYYLPCGAPANIKPHNLRLLPNWPTDRNASYELIKGIQFGEFPEVMPAREESLLFLEHKGYRWVDCKEFRCVEGKEQVFDQMTWPDCQACDGNAGKWLHDETADGG